MRKNSRNAVHALMIQAAKDGARSIAYASASQSPEKGRARKIRLLHLGAGLWAVLEGPEGDEAWELYAKTLEAEVERLRKRKGASHGEQ